MRMLVLAASEKPITLAPSLFAAVSKLRRVLVEGSKKIHVEDVQDLLLGKILD